jgi:hypothetical protein
MSEKPPSKDEALEALDFIVNVLKEHEKDLDKLVCELGTVAGQLGESGEINDKVRKIEDKITNLQNEVCTLVKSLSNQPTQTAASTTPQTISTQITQTPQVPKSETSTPKWNPNIPLLFRCKKWEDFQAISLNAQTISFTIKEDTQTFEANAIKNNQIINYNGQTPTITTLLKMYLSKELNVTQNQVLEGEILTK